MPVIIIAIISIFMVSEVVASQNNSLYVQAERKIQERKAQELNLPSGTAAARDASKTENTPDFPIINGAQTTETVSVSKSSWIAVEKPEPRQIKVHDLVSIRINETSSHNTKADTKTEREFDVDHSLSDWIKFTNGNLGLAELRSGKPKISASLSSEFEGKGDISRSDSLRANIMAKVVDVMPNGNLALIATHTIITDDETTIITLTGQCRSDDVKFDNSVLSTQIFNLKIEKKHSGAARNATKLGLMQKLFGWMNIF